MKKIALLSLVASTILMAGGYRIPETSLNAVALSGANIASNKSADAAYFNPANMVFMEDKNNMELDLSYIGLDAPNYKGTNKFTGFVVNHDLDAEKENFLIPTIHYVSEKTGNARIGLSIVSPGGLSKRWNEEPAKTSAQEFTLKTIEINPTVAIPISDKVAFAFGFRIVHTEGIVKSDGNIGYTVTRDMTGDGLDFGYNLALAYNPTKDLNIALTYRSEVSLNVEGNAKLYASGVGGGSYDGYVSLTVPLPAVFDVAVAYTLPSKTTVEFVYERTNWSAYKTLDFDYDGTITSPKLIGVFDDAKPKDWVDTHDFRLGITQELNKMTLMAGVVFSQTPVPDETIGFELPDSDSTSVSFGGRYEINDKMEVGLAALYSMRESRKVNNDSLVGEFTNSNILMISTGISYKF